jgi:hypothetical protein
MPQKIILNITSLLLIAFTPSVYIAGEKSTEEVASYQPMMETPISWEFNQYWQQKRIGNRDFYFVEHGPYQRMNEEAMARIKQVGLYSRCIPGHFNMYGSLKAFDPEETEKLPQAGKDLVAQFLANRWPLHSLIGHRHHGAALPSAEALKIVDELWMGDGHPELTYRLEPIFHYLKTGEKWKGSSMHSWEEDKFFDYFKNELIPELEKEFPFLHDLNHRWTRAELCRMCDIYCESFFRPMGRPVAWGMYLSPYHLLMLPGVFTVGEKGADSRHAARGHGLIRRFADQKFFFIWRGHEPTERYGYHDRASMAATLGGCREAWGYPRSLMNYYIFRPWLIGANYYTNEAFPESCIQDIESDGQLELSTTGRILKDMLDFVDRHPDRGTVYSPVALLQDYNRPLPDESGGTTFRGYNLPFDEADHMNFGLMELLFPEHRHVKFSGDYGCVAPFGEIFDIMVADLPKQGTDLEALKSYKLLFTLGGLTVNPEMAGKLETYVQDGGALVLNVEDAGANFSPGFFGAKIHDIALKGDEVVNETSGVKIKENAFTFRLLQSEGAEVVYSCKGLPLVTKNKVGKGVVFLVAASHLVQDGAEMIKSGRSQREFESRPLLKFAEDLIEHLTAGLCPVEVRRRPQDKEDLSWIINKKGDGWTVTVFNYSLERETAPLTIGTAGVLDLYPLKALPFEIVCRVPVGDAAELYEDRDVNWQVRDGQAVISESIRGGEIRVYEIQPGKVEFLPRNEYVNYARNKPVTASSTYKGFTPRTAIDGDTENENYWQSDTDEKRHYKFDMPQWLEVDMEELRDVTHAYIQFHAWPLETLDTRLRVYKYVIELSEDREKWVTVIDESKNEDPARGFGLERWFEPVKARYARLTVFNNSAFSGAQVVELKILGDETETVRPVRKKITPLSQAEFAPEIADHPADKIKYLRNLEPVRLSPGWMPTGSDWKKLNGFVQLKCKLSEHTGTTYHKSIYAQSNFDATWAVPENASTFVAAAGLGAATRDASVVFHVYVDGEERLNSQIFRIGRPVIPVVIPVKGAKEIRLVVDDSGDGITNDYAWWGDARFLTE